MAPLLIGAIVSMLAGTALQYHAQQQARARQQQALQEALQRQRAFQQQAEHAVMERAPEFAAKTRQQRQNEIVERLRQQMMAPVKEAQPAHQEAAAVQGQLSADYLHARAQSQANQMKSAQTLARLLGQTMAAGQLRQQEGLGLLDTAQEMERVGRNAQGMQQADQVAIQQAGIPSLWQQMLGQLLLSAGSAGMVQGIGTPTNTAPNWTGQGTTGQARLSPSAVDPWAENYGNPGLWARNRYGLKA